MFCPKIRRLESSAEHVLWCQLDENCSRSGSRGRGNGSSKDVALTLDSELRQYVGRLTSAVCFSNAGVPFPCVFFFPLFVRNVCASEAESSDWNNKITMLVYGVFLLIQTSVTSDNHVLIKKRKVAISHQLIVRIKV